jgi:nucleoside-diphosphate-sugar epimerase
MSNILITGGSGFIGAFLKEKFPNHLIYAPTHAELDLTNYETTCNFFDTHNIDIVVHTALIGRHTLKDLDVQSTQQNLDMFFNLWKNRHRFKKFINTGTGNEFDSSTDIHLASEDELFNHIPNNGYDYFKNLIARICRTTENFINLRLFGVFHHSENPIRFFKRLSAETNEFHIFGDHYFDFINLEDLCTVIDLTINEEILYNDINIVYEEKYKLSDLAKTFAKVNNFDESIIIVDTIKTTNFTGDPTRLKSLNLRLKGIEEGFKLYK